jgi:hypothetical protein
LWFNKEKGLDGNLWFQRYAKTTTADANVLNIANNAIGNIALTASSFSSSAKVLEENDLANVVVMTGGVEIVFTNVVVPLRYLLKNTVCDHNKNGGYMPWRQTELML